MTEAEKKAWTEKASPKELLETYLSMTANNRYGCYAEDIRLVEAEIIKRMEGNENVEH